MYYVFRNAGTIDPRSISTFGVSSKDNPQSAIGFFGTGLKYAIAIILRSGGDIKIYTNGDRYSFGVEQTRIRNDDFQVVTMQKNDNKPVPLGFTTELGKTWKMWQAFRELYCNMKDEGGECFETPVPQAFKMPGHTVIAVTGSRFGAVWADRASIVLEGRKPLASGSGLEVYAGSSKYIYYKGVRTQALDQPMLYTYNITDSHSLTEDRSFAHSWMTNVWVAQGINALDKENIQEELILQQQNKDTWEQKLDFSSVPMTPELQQLAMRHARAFNPNLNRTLRAALEHASFSDLVVDETDSLDDIDRRRLNKALDFLEQTGYAVAGYPIKVSSHLGENTLGRAENGTIWLSTRTFSMGTKMLAGTILEEYIHLKHGHADCDRPMQNFLIDALMSMGERLTGNVL